MSQSTLYEPQCLSATSDIQNQHNNYDIGQNRPTYYRDRQSFSKNAEEIESLRLKYLGKKGEITNLMADFRNVAPEDKKTVGIKINELKQLAIQKINELKENADTGNDTLNDIDLTRSAYPIHLGARHPLTITRNKIIDIFQRMGFSIAEGPEIDDDLHVFTKLNFAADHPARDMQDTFFIETNKEDVTKT